MNIIEQTIFPTEGSRSHQNNELAYVVFVIALATFLRFWGLGNVGLHGDEETTIFPALALLEQGGPYFPSGMFYARALAQSYLIAGSVWIFGESEWAARLPSALIGSIMPLFAFFLGRRFLSPRFNRIYIAIIAVLPAMIELAQTARMYVFWLAALMFFGSCVFRWERKDTLASLAAALVAWLVALHFHALSILAAPVFLFPGLIRKSWRNLIQGAIAIGACILAYKINGAWIGAQYPDSSERPVREVVGILSADPSPLLQYWAQYPWLLVVSIIITMAVVASIGVKVVQRGRFASLAALLLLGTGYAACAALHYHIGLLALLFGTVIWLRDSSRPKRSLFAILGIVGAMAAFQAFFLYQTGEYPGRQLIGAMIGEPSIWPILRFAEYSPVAIGLYLVVLAYATYRLAAKHRIPDHMLFFAIAVWAPLVAIGTETWYPELRYMAGVLPFFLLCCIAGLEYLWQQWSVTSTVAPRRRLTQAFLGALLVFSIANPGEFLQVVNNGYERHPDHKGAAEFLKSLPISDNDVIIAEDVLQQTYYLGEVDYWLRVFDNARGYAVDKGDVNIDQYTATPIIGDGNSLLELLDKNMGRRVFIIGSGEILPGREEWARGRGISDVLRMERLKVVYEGRDGITRVWVDGT